MRKTAFPQFDDPEWLTAPYYSPRMWSWFGIRPEGVSSALLDRIKHAAKLLSAAAGIKRTKALEHLATAFRFENWHQLRLHLENPIPSCTGAGHSQWAERLKLPAFLLDQAEPEVALPFDLSRGLELIGSRIAQSADLPLVVVLDSVCAKMANAESWKEGLERSPLDAKLPLYSTEFAFNAFRFISSGACRELVELVRQKLPQNPTREQIQGGCFWLLSVTKKQPGFIHGFLAYAQWENDLENYKYALALVDHALSLADDLIPQDYKGTIDWYEGDNRVYLCIIWLKLEITQNLGNPKACLGLAKRLLKLNPRDNQGARMVLPLLQIQLGEYSKSLRSNREKADTVFLSTEYLARAFAHFGVGNYQSFVRDLVTAVFDFPWLRCFLMNDPNALPRYESGTRAITPDMELFSNFGWQAYLAVPGLMAACQAILKKPALIKAEKELCVYWNGFWRATDPVGNSDGWRSLKSRHISELEVKLAPRMVW